jgi:hypothetical protein
MVLGAPPDYLAAGAAVTATVAISAYRPYIGMLFIVVLASSILHEDTLPTLPLPIGSLLLSDVVLLVLLASVFVRIVMSRKERMAASALNLPMSAFLFLILVSVYNAVEVYNVPFKLVMQESRKVLYYTLFFVAVNTLKDRKDVENLVRGMLFVACAVSAAMVVQAALGESVKIMPGRVETLETMGSDYQGVTRVLPPGQTLVFVMFVTAVCMAVLRRKWMSSTWGAVTLSLLSAGMLLTFNRNYWAAALLGLCVFGVSVSQGQRAKMAAMSLVTVLVAGTAVTVLSGTNGRMGDYARAASDRMGFLVQGGRVMKSRSLDFRRMENIYAVSQIKKTPVLGIGIANRYRPALLSEIDFRDRYPSPPRYIHNGYLWLTLISGLLGVSAFLWLCITFIVRGLRMWRKMDGEFMKAVVAGFTVSCAGMMAAAVVNPLFMQRYSIVVLGIMMGVTEAIININKAEAET